MISRFIEPKFVGRMSPIEIDLPVVGSACESQVSPRPILPIIIADDHASGWIVRYQIQVLMPLVWRAMRGPGDGSRAHELKS